MRRRQTHAIVTAPRPSSRNIPRSLPTMRPIYTPKHDPTLVNSVPILSDPRHILHNNMLATIAARPRNNLWWNVKAPMTTSAAAVVRKWLKRRVKAAFMRALAAEGFDEDGRVQGDEARHLSGTLTMLASKHILTLPRTSLDVDSKKLVQALMSHCEIASSRSKS